jgi:RNA ligase
MKLLDYIDETQLIAHCNSHVVNVQHHPALPLAIYNYGRKATFDCIWDDVTCRTRGLIVDQSSGEIIARPFEKFFNYDTAYRPETAPANLPTDTPEITEKLDGSLGILYRFKGFTGIATRGSFASEQATWASAWYGKHLADAKWPEGWTPLFEIIYPANRVVVKYDFEGLTLLGMVNIETGEEMRYPALVTWAKGNGCRVVELANKSIEECRSEDTKNAEGYVLSWHREAAPSIKIKIKFNDYFRLHHLLTGLSPKAVWEMLRDGLPFDEVTTDVPVHFLEWLNSWRGALEAEYGRIEQKAKAIWAQCPLPKDGKDKESRKALAEFFRMGDRLEVAPILFGMLDGKDNSAAIWKMVRPLTASEDCFKPVDE